jgi:hypothetical protein
VQRATPWTLDTEWKLQSEVKWDLDGLLAAAGDADPPTNRGRDTGIVR